MVIACWHVAHYCHNLCVWIYDFILFSFIQPEVLVPYVPYACLVCSFGFHLHLFSSALFFVSTTLAPTPPHPHTYTLTTHKWYDIDKFEFLFFLNKRQHKTWLFITKNNSTWAVWTISSSASHRKTLKVTLSQGSLQIVLGSWQQSSLTCCAPAASVAAQPPFALRSQKTAISAMRMPVEWLSVVCVGGVLMIVLCVGWKNLAQN